MGTEQGTGYGDRILKQDIWTEHRNRISGRTQRQDFTTEHKIDIKTGIGRNKERQDMGEKLRHNTETGHKDRKHRQDTEAGDRDKVWRPDMRTKQRQTGHVNKILSHDMETKLKVFFDNFHDFLIRK